MPFSAYMQKAVLDWVLGGANPTRPAARFIGLATGSPTSVSDSSGPMSRVTCLFGPAASPAGSASNTAVMTVIATLAATPNAWFMYDATTASTYLMYGTLAASTALSAGRPAGFAAGGLVLVLS